MPDDPEIFHPSEGDTVYSCGELFAVGYSTQTVEGELHNQTTGDIHEGFVVGLVNTSWVMLFTNVKPGCCRLTVNHARHHRSDQVEFCVECPEPKKVRKKKKPKSRRTARK